MQPRSLSGTRTGAAIADALLAFRPPRRRTVLFVSEDSDLRSAVTRVLEQENYDVRAVAHSGHAVLLGRTTQFDVLVTELSGPDVSGPMLFDQLRRHSPALTAVYFASSGTAHGAEVVLVSPFTREELLHRLDTTPPSRAV